MNKKFELKYGDTVLGTVVVDKEYVELVAHEHAAVHPTATKNIETLARSLIAAGMSLLATTALVQEADRVEARASAPSPKTLDELCQQLEGITLPPTPASRFARSMMSGLLTYAQEHFAESGIDINTALKGEE